MRKTSKQGIRYRTQGKTRSQAPGKERSSRKGPGSFVQSELRAKHSGGEIEDGKKKKALVDVPWAKKRHPKEKQKSTSKGQRGERGG